MNKIIKINEKSPEEIFEEIKNYDIISFDIFDTLIFRSFYDPKDLFRTLSEYHNILNFYHERIKAEKTVRKLKLQKFGHHEITLEEIYQELHKNIGIDIDLGCKVEFKKELECIYPNPYMKKLFNLLVDAKKTIIIVSDMYLNNKYMVELLKKCGYTKYNKLFVSCDYNANKRNGKLFEIVRNEFKNKSIIHLGDKLEVDYLKPREYGIDSMLYQAPNTIPKHNYNMTYSISSLYHGIVYNKLYNGINDDKTQSVYYRYGYEYCGIFMLGYVNYIHNYALENNLDKLLFLSRDGYIIKKVYDKLFNDIPGEYVLWSRYATLKTDTKRDFSRFLWQFVSRKVSMNENITVEEILIEMDYVDLLDVCKKTGIYSHTTLKNKKVLQLFLQILKDNSDYIFEKSKKYSDNAKEYYKNAIGKNKRLGIVDIGYRASGAISLINLFKEWGFDCVAKALVAFGTVNRSSFDDTLLLNNTVSSYVFSNDKNKNLSLSKDSNRLLLEVSIIDVLLASAPYPSFHYFDVDDKGQIKPVFETENKNNYKKINQLHDGIMDFIKEYTERTGENKYLLNIPGYDSFLPVHSILKEKSITEKFIDDFNSYIYSYMVSNSSKKDTYLSDIYKEFKQNKKKNRLRHILVKCKVKIKKVINKAKKKVKKIFKIFKRIKNLIVRLRYTNYYEKLKVETNLVLAQSYGGMNFYGNIYYILKEMINRNECNSFKFYVGARKNEYHTVKKFVKNQFGNKVKVLIIDSKKYLYVLSRAKYLLNNVGFPTYFIKKMDQIYLNTWHGTPLKGLGRSILDAPNESGNYQRNLLMADYLIFPNFYTCESMRKDYMLDNLYKGKYILEGYPRNSVFLNEKIKQNIKEKYNLINKEIIVYMPTWRRKPKNNETDIQISKCIELLDYLETKLKSNQLLYVKLHNLVNKQIDFKKYKKIKLFPNDCETYEFLSISDALITDYSSVMFDYINCNKKIILYTYDLNEYINGRSIQFDIKELPFNTCLTKESVLKEIKNINVFKDYSKIKDKFCEFDNMHSSKKLVDLILHKAEKEVKIFDTPKNNMPNALIYCGKLNVEKKTYNLLNNLSELPTNINFYLNFYNTKINKNKFVINEIPKNINYITLQGSKLFTISELICFNLYYRFNIENKRIIDKINKMYCREIKRLYPQMKFKYLIGYNHDTNIMNMFALMEGKKYLFLDKDNTTNRRQIKNLK